jgi:hypothetical protein
MPTKFGHFKLAAFKEKTTGAEHLALKTLGKKMTGTDLCSFKLFNRRGFWQFSM